MYQITSDDVYYGIREILPNISAVFFDRDGTLCKDTGYLNKHEDLNIFSDIEDIKLLKENGFALIGITNQSGIARGKVEEDFVKEVNTLFMKRYNFDDFYYCPHHPDEHCSCRKPELGMVFKARARHRIDLKKSYVIGDKEADMLLAKGIGAKGILVLTGLAKESDDAYHVAKNLKEAVIFILNESMKR
jgi:heptosyltransferase-2